MDEAIALSPDGEQLINQDFREYELRTGHRRTVFHLDEVQGLRYYGGGGGYMGWSVDGRYFAATQLVFGERELIADRPVVVIDTQTQTARYYPGPFTEWSAINAERFVLSRATVVERETGAFVSWPEIPLDLFTEEVLGYGALLWSVKRNLPIGIIGADPPYIGLDAKKVREQPRWLYIEDWATRSKRVPLYQEGRLERVVNGDFDPTGQFVLLMVWERSRVPEDPNALNWGEVTDTKLVLIDWRRGEQRVLFRLSQIGDGQVVAVGWMSTWHWSADGSTIIVPRQDGSVVVLKVDYPGRRRLKRLRRHPGHAKAGCLMVYLPTPPSAEAPHHVRPPILACPPSMAPGVAGPALGGVVAGRGPI